MRPFSGGNGSHFLVDNGIFPDTPIETLVMHSTNTQDARSRAGQSPTCKVLETPSTLCNRNVIILLLGFWPIFQNSFQEKRVMRNGVSSVSLKQLEWGSPEPNQNKANQPHFQRFVVRTFRVFAPWNLLRDPPKFAQPRLSRAR